MRILLFIDSLVSGGAQRQISLLARSLKYRQHTVLVVCYEKKTFFAPELYEANVPILWLSPKRKLFRISEYFKAVAEFKPDAVIAYLDTPSMIADVASLVRKNYVLIVSERGVADSTIALRARIRFQLHRLADSVVTNSFDIAKHIKKSASWLLPKIRVIRNAVELDNYSIEGPTRRSCDSVQILCLGRIRPQKNPIRLLKALRQHNSQNSTKIKIDWYGNTYVKNGVPGLLAGTYLELASLIEKWGMHKQFRIHETVENAHLLYRNYDAVCLPSLQEGFSNVICEALASGKPVLTGRISDNPEFLEEGKTGLLFDPQDINDIERTLRKFTEMSTEERERMSSNCRQLAEQELKADRLATQYEQLIVALQ